MFTGAELDDAVHISGLRRYEKRLDDEIFRGIIAAALVKIVIILITRVSCRRSYFFIAGETVLFDDERKPFHLYYTDQRPYKRLQKAAAEESRDGGGKNVKPEGTAFGGED